MVNAPGQSQAFCDTETTHTVNLVVADIKSFKEGRIYEHAAQKHGRWLNAPVLLPKEIVVHFDC